MRKMIMLVLSALLVAGLAAPAFAAEARPTDRDRQQSHEMWRGHDGRHDFDRHDWWRHDRDGWRHHDRDDRWWFRDGRDRDDD